MKNTYGTALTVTLFGESHGPAVGAILDGLAPEIAVNEDRIRLALSRRRPSGATATARVEPDDFAILSGVYRGKTTGTPLCITIPNTAQESADYDALADVLRPGQSDLGGLLKYHGYADPRGAGHFSGRLTAALVAVGTIVRDALAARGVRIATHLSRCAGIDDRAFDTNNFDAEAALLSGSFATLSSERGDKMRAAILAAKQRGDSVGGVCETVVVGMPGGVGEPWFDTLEGALAHILFSVPAVKGVEFGDGFALADRLGSASNDALRAEGSRILSDTNRMGGILGGVSNGMPIVFRCAVKPTPSIAVEQNTVNRDGENCTVSVGGRHDPCIAPRACPVIDAVTALCLADLLCVRFGTDWLGAK